jgi:hypothetical protein
MTRASWLLLAMACGAAACEPGPARDDATAPGDVDSAWLAPDSTWTTVRSEHWAFEFRMPPNEPIRLRGPRRTICHDTLPTSDPASWPVYEGDTTSGIPVLRVYYTREPFDSIVSDVGFDSVPRDGWVLAADQRPVVATRIGGEGWRGLEASAFGRWGELEPEWVPRRLADTTDESEAASSGFDLHVAVAMFPRAADGCTVVLEVSDEDVGHRWSAVFGTVTFH